MADDTRQCHPTSPSDQDPNAQPSQGKVYEGTFPTPASKAQIAPPQNANSMPGGTYNTAGGKQKEFTFMDGLKSIHPSDFRQFHEMPCVRDGMVTGITAGMGLGGGMAIWGKPIPKAANWAVGTWAFTSFVAFQICITARKYEKEGIQRANELMEKKKLDKMRRMEEARKARRKAKEEEDARLEEEQKKKSSWWFWR